MSALTAAAPPLSDPDRAAILIMVLDEEQAATILAQLGPGELRMLGERMCALGEIGPDQIEQAIAGFVAGTEQSGLARQAGTGRVRSLMNRAVGPVRTDSLMRRIAPDEADLPAMDLVRWLNADVIVPLVCDEHPQAIAVMLVQIEAEVAAQVLRALAPEMQTQVLHRIATLGPVRAEATAMLDQLLEQRIVEQHGRAVLKMGGPREAADIINSAGKVIEKQVLPAIGKIDKTLARAIESEMFKFEHLFELDSQSIGALLREVESETLIDALKGLDDGQREVFFRAMSSRAADGVKDEIEARGRLKLTEVQDAQKEIVAIARRLAEDGTIAFGMGGNDEYV